MKLTRILTLLCTFMIGIAIFGVASVRAAEKNFSAKELAAFDGQNGRKAYFAYKGKVYDVSESSLWKLGEHFGVRAGIDLTNMMGGAPHGDEVMDKVPMVGTFGIVESPQPASTKTAESSRAWYDAPIRIAGLSLLGWTGLLLGIVFVLNFATCFALPWSKLDLPWTGSRPGPDPLDASGMHMKWTMLHKYFAWATVILGIVHGIIGFMQVFLKMVL